MWPLLSLTTLRVRYCRTATRVTARRRLRQVLYVLVMFPSGQDFRLTVFKLTKDTTLEILLSGFHKLLKEMKDNRCATLFVNHRLVCRWFVAPGTLPQTLIPTFSAMIAHVLRAAIQVSRSITLHVVSCAQSGSERRTQRDTLLYKTTRTSTTRAYRKRQLSERSSCLYFGQMSYFNVSVVQFLFISVNHADVWFTTGDCVEKQHSRLSCETHDPQGLFEGFASRSKELSGICLNFKIKKIIIRDGEEDRKTTEEFGCKQTSRWRLIGRSLKAQPAQKGTGFNQHRGPAWCGEWVH